MASLTVALADSPFPYAALALATYLRVNVEFGEQTALRDQSGATITGLETILDVLVKGKNIAGTSSKVAGS